MLATPSVLRAQAPLAVRFAQQRIGHFTAFLNRIGTLKTRVDNWQELFWETAHHLQGN